MDQVMTCLTYSPGSTLECVDDHSVVINRALPPSLERVRAVLVLLLFLSIGYPLATQGVWHSLRHIPYLVDLI